jgi:hypothetical protein
VGSAGTGSQTSQLQALAAAQLLLIPLPAPHKDLASGDVLEIYTMEIRNVKCCKRHEIVTQSKEFNA